MVTFSATVGTVIDAWPATASDPERAAGLCRGPFSGRPGQAGTDEGVGHPVNA